MFPQDFYVESNPEEYLTNLKNLGVNYTVQFIYKILINGGTQRRQELNAW